MSNTTLEVTNLHVWRGQQHILQGVNLQSSRGELVCLTSDDPQARRDVLHGLMGIGAKREGSVRVHNIESVHLDVLAMGNLGINYCSKSTGVVRNLSCEENLLLPLTNMGMGGGLPLGEIYSLLPMFKLNKDISAARLPPGEQHLLSVARALRGGADLLLINDLFTGIAPVIKKIAIELLEALKEQGYTIILTERSNEPIQHLSDRLYQLHDGLLYDAHTSLNGYGTNDLTHHTSTLI